MVERQVGLCKGSLSYLLHIDELQKRLTKEKGKPSKHYHCEEVGAWGAKPLASGLTAARETGRHTAGLTPAPPFHRHNRGSHKQNELHRQVVLGKKRPVLGLEEEETTWRRV